jgi:hypothetical protein
MKLYKATVRLSGSNDNEVPKIGLTAPEILILRSIHGDDAVVRIVETSQDKRSNAAERERLTQLYGLPAVNKIFPGAYTPLPTELPKAEREPEAPLDEEVESLLG